MSTGTRQMGHVSSLSEGSAQEAQRHRCPHGRHACVFSPSMQMEHSFSSSGSDFDGGGGGGASVMPHRCVASTAASWFASIASLLLRCLCFCRCR